MCFIIYFVLRFSIYARHHKLHSFYYQRGKKKAVCLFDVVSVTLTMHAFTKREVMDFKIDRVPAHSSWIHQFSLQAVQTRNSPNDVMYFVYPGDKTQQCSKSVTRQLLLADFNCLPQDFFFASKINQSDYTRVFLVKQGQNLPYGITLDDYPNCCSQTIEDYFFANLSLPSKYC